MKYQRHHFQISKLISWECCDRLVWWKFAYLVYPIQFLSSLYPQLVLKTTLNWRFHSPNHPIDQKPHNTPFRRTPTAIKNGLNSQTPPLIRRNTNAWSADNETHSGLPRSIHHIRNWDGRFADKKSRRHCQRMNGVRRSWSFRKIGIHKKFVFDRVRLSCWIWRWGKGWTGGRKRRGAVRISWVLMKSENSSFPNG